MRENAYKAKRAEQVLRCRRAVQRNFQCSDELCLADADAALAWRTHVQESRNFVDTLNPYYVSANKKVKLRSVNTAGKASCFCISNVQAPTERNFMKQMRNRRNGCAAGTVRRLIPCEKTRRLQREVDASEKNEHHVAEALS